MVEVPLSPALVGGLRGSQPCLLLTSSPVQATGSRFERPPSHQASTNAVEHLGLIRCAHVPRHLGIFSGSYQWRMATFLPIAEALREIAKALELTDADPSAQPDEPIS